MPEATPRRSGPTAPSTELLFGEVNSPMPSPTTASPALINGSGVDRSIRESRNSPIARTPIPTVAGMRDPILSESAPLSDAITAITIGCEVSTSPT